MEYLIQSLNEHISNCLDLRAKAQELEIRAFFEVSDQLLTQALLESIKKQSTSIATSEPKLLGNTISARIEDGRVEGDVSSTYWADFSTEENKQIDAKKDESINRLKKMQEPGSGVNYVARFDFLKGLFNKDLKEAYCRARSAELGLGAVYNINFPVPPIENVGYLDALTLWSRDVTYELEKRFFKQRFATIVFALHDNDSGIGKVLSPTDYREYRNGLKIKFTLGAHHFIDAAEPNNFNLKNPRLRALDIHFMSEQQPHENLRLFRAKIALPTQRIRVGSITGDDYIYSPVVYSPATPINYRSNNFTSLDLEQLREVHNVNPIGEWEISFEKNSISGEAGNTDESAKNIYLRMRVAYNRE